MSGAAGAMQSGSRRESRQRLVVCLPPAEIFKNGGQLGGTACEKWGETRRGQRSLIPVCAQLWLQRENLEARREGMKLKTSPRLEQSFVQESLIPSLPPNRLPEH